MREEWGRLVALLLAQFRRLDLVEDALGDAVEAASRTWPTDGVPTNPAGWLMTAAKRRVVDRLRTEAVAARKQPLLLTDAERHQQGARTMADGSSLLEDDVLRLMLMCGVGAGIPFAVPDASVLPDRSTRSRRPPTSPSPPATPPAPAPTCCAPSSPGRRSGW